MTTLLSVGICGIAYFALDTLASWGTILPGVGIELQEPPPILGAVRTMISLGILLGLVSVLLSGLSMRYGAHALNDAVKATVSVLGLRAPATRILGLTLTGATVGGITYWIKVVIVRHISIPSTGVDVHSAAVQGAEPWVAGLYFALFAPSEELLYRGPLLALGFVVSQRLSNRGRGRWVLVSAILVMVSLAFGAAHVPHSLGNAVTAGVSGLIYGGVALATRSLWPAVVAHAVGNFLVGM